jgi:hypothetical protein
MFGLEREDFLHIRDYSDISFVSRKRTLMLEAGLNLRMLREQLGLTMRDVEAAMTCPPRISPAEM